MAALGAAVSACATRSGDVAYDPAGFGAPDRTAFDDVPYDIALGPLDQIRITVFRVNDLSGDYQIDMNGMVDLPLLGSISARGQKAPEFAQHLEALYGRKYLNNPDITVKVLTTNQLNVTIEGGITQPGIYALPGRTTLLGAIALARGINAEGGNPRRVIVLRKIDGKTAAAGFDLVAIRRLEMADPLIYPGDKIIVESNQMRSIYRELLNTIPLLAVFRSL